MRRTNAVLCTPETNLVGERPGVEELCLQSVRSIDGFARDVAKFLAAPPAARGSLQEVQKNMPTRIAAMQPHCSSMIRSRSTSAAKASVTSG